MDDKTSYTLLECVEEYLAQRQINKKKYLDSYLVCAKNYWKHLFRNTIYAVNSEWTILKKGEPYNYLDIPKRCMRLFSVSTVDECNKQIPLYYDNQVNILTKPTFSESKCKCGKCDCGGLCDDVNSLTYTTKVLFTINGVDYIEKKWLKVCPNGDVIEYRIVPTKKYNTFEGDGGDYMDDYMNDYDIGGAPFSDYTIVYTEFQKVICKLEMKPCGCPENTPENIDLIKDNCGCYLPLTACCKKKQCHDFLGDINDNRKGYIKISECGTKIYYIPHSGVKSLPDYLLVNYQTSGENCSNYVQVPEYALDCMFTGIDHFSKRFNGAYSRSEKTEAKYAARASENELIMFLNLLNLEWLSQVQDAEIKF